MLSRFKCLEDVFISQHFEHWVLQITPDPDLVQAIKEFDKIEKNCTAKYESLLKDYVPPKTKKNNGDGRRRHVPTAPVKDGCLALINMVEEEMKIPRTLSADFQIDAPIANTDFRDLRTHAAMVEEKNYGSGPIRNINTDDISMTTWKCTSRWSTYMFSGCAINMTI